MATLRRPFLDAYRHAAAGSAANPVAGSRPASSAYLGSSELAMGGTPNLREAEAQTRYTVHSPTETLTPDASRPSRPRPKRPLSSFLHNFDEPPSPAPLPPPAQAAQWPAICLELLATAAPAYDKLLTSFNSDKSLGSIVGVLGCGASSGATTTAICLALRCATRGISTLLVDADLAKANLGEQLALPVERSWIRWIKEGNSLERAIVSAQEVSIDLLLNHPNDHGPLDTWSRFHAGNAAGQMRRQYRQTLVDLGHDLQVAQQVIDTLAIDRVILTCHPETTSEEQLHIQQTLAAQGTQVTGILRAT